jgi:hypothetical protein
MTSSPSFPSRSVWLAALAGLALVAGAEAAAVKVAFVAPDKYIDAGDTAAERDITMKALEAHLTRLGAALPADMTLDVEVTEVDLAGRIEWLRGQNIRIVRGLADWPRITLRYSLAKDGQVQASGTDALDDMNYTMQIGSTRASDPMFYEKRLLDNWFRARLGDRVVAQLR